MSQPRIKKKQRNFAIQRRRAAHNTGSPEQRLQKSAELIRDQEHLELILEEMIQKNGRAVANEWLRLSTPWLKFELKPVSEKSEA